MRGASTKVRSWGELQEPLGGQPEEQSELSPSRECGERQAGQVLKVRSLDFILGARREEAAGHF